MPISFITLFMLNLFSNTLCQVTKPELFEKNRETCMRIAKDPYFDIDMVIGKPWRIYFTWNMKLDTKCLDMVFRNATPEVTKPELFEKNRETCMRIAKDPYFDIDMVIGKPWRIYFTWNMKLDTKCLDMVFRNATPEIIKRIWSDMNEYLEQEPNWEAATLHMYMGSARHELLLFADQGAAGTFLAVPNVIRDPNGTPLRKSIPLLKFQMKLVRRGKYLLVMDCHVGGASLAARPFSPPYRSEIAAEALTLNLGEGFPACTMERNKGEQFLVK